MADVKISQLPPATTPVAGTEVLPIVQSGTTSRVSLNDATGITRPFTANGVLYASSTTALTTGSALTFNGTNFATTGSVTSAGASNSGNLNFTGTGNRITGDFSNATVASRVMFQNSTVNANTVVGAIPNGTGNYSEYRVFNSSDPANSSELDISVSASSARIRSDITGTGAYLPLTFATGGSERVRIDTSGNVGIGTSSPGARLQITSAAAAVEALKITDATNYTLVAGYTASSVGYIGGATGTTFALYANGSERARIDSSGNVGIGVVPVDGRGRFQSVRTGVSGGNPVTSGSTDANQLATIGNENVSMRFGIYSSGAMWIQPSGIANYGVNYDAVLNPNGGNVGIGTSSPTQALTVNGAVGYNAPVTVTSATYTVATTDNWLIANRAGTVTLTLPTAASFTGRILTVKNVQAQTVISASSNVVPIGSTTAGTAILAATAGKFAKLVSDGTNWIIMQAN